ncbi:HtaA domain-containing protein [Streptomyces sp. NPDC094034]|uniref:HtaA domain-containing protein n=1 Tax=Streptomyces sp. NPDC094034 TaxID=3155309 RepID=UPI003326C3FC
MAATRRPIALTAAIATAAALGATAFTVPALASGAPADAPQRPLAAPGAAPKLDLKDGTLDWGLKESFRTYVAGMAAGTITATDGATQATGNGPFTFTNGTGSYDPATHDVATDFDGGVLFSSKAHGFEIKVADVRLVTAGTGGAIEADVTLNGATQNDIELAAIDLTGIRPQTTGGRMVLKDIPATLTADGAKAFNGMYAEGTELDKATLAVGYETGGGTSSPPPSTEPGPTTAPTSEVTAPGPTPTATSPTATSPATAPSSTSPSTAPSSTSPSTAPSTAAPAAPPRAEDGAIVDGTLDWGVKESFRSYVVGTIARGKVELSDGAAKSGATAYRFPEGTGDFDATARTLSASFGGTVRFLGHQDEDGEYVLDVRLSGLQVVVEDGKGTLVADVSTKDQETHKVATYQDLTLATLDIPAAGPVAKDGVVTLNAVPATLTADGTKAFGGMYQEGTELDRLTLAVAFDENANLPGGTGGSGTSGTGGSDGIGAGGSDGTGAAGGGIVGGAAGGSLASTGAGVPAGALMGAAGAIAAVGAAVVFAAQRRRTGRAKPLGDGA